MRKTLPALAVLAAAALTLGACNNPNDDAVANDTMADTAATMPADNTMVDTNVMVDTNATVDTNTMDTNTAVNTTTNTTY